LKDTDFDRLSERAALLTNAGYFSRHRELAAIHGVTEAWAMVEAELPFGLRRFTSFHSFENAKKLEAEGAIPKKAVFSKE
jgi:hypothetical protein